MEDYQNLQYTYLEQAEEMFGPKTDYIYAGLWYNNTGPRVILCRKHLEKGVKAFRVELNGKGAAASRTDGIFQLSHEVVHLLSPVEQDEDNEVNFLEEGMATYFSKTITERETGDLDFCDPAIQQRPEYARALELYDSLRQIDENAVRKLRGVCPVIANIQREHFEQAGLVVSDELIDALLAKF